MKRKKLFPLKKEKEKEIFGGWSNSSGDNWIDPVEVWGNPGYYDDSNPYDGWGGEPQDGGGGGSRDTSTENSHELEKAIEMCRQTDITGECTYFALGALAKYFDVEGLHKDDFAEHAGVANNIMEALNTIVLDPTSGMSPELFNSVLDDFFVNSPVSDTNGIIQHLDRGEPIIATLMTGPNSGHAVIITGYNSSNNMVTISNSLVEGTVETIQFDPSLLTDLSAVSGVQDNDIVDKYKNDENDWWKNCNYSTN